MSTLVVYGKGDNAIMKVSRIANDISVVRRVSFRTKMPKFWQYQPRFEVRFHDLTAQEIAAIKVKLAFVEDINRIELI